MPPRPDLLQWLDHPDHPLLMIKSEDAIPPDAESLIDARLRTLNHGLLISSRRFLLAIPRPIMAYTRYSIL